MKTKLFTFFLILTLVLSCNNNYSEQPSDSDLGAGRSEIFEQRARAEQLATEETQQNNEYKEEAIQQPNYNWYCAWCSKIIQAYEEPGYSICPGPSNPKTFADESRGNHNPHSWRKIGEVGENLFECANCGENIYLVEKPSTGREGRCDATAERRNCSGCGHEWQKL